MNGKPEIYALQSMKNMVKYRIVPKKKSLGSLSGAIPAGLASGDAVEEREAPQTNLNPPAPLSGGFCHLYGQPAEVPKEGILPAAPE